MQRCESGVEGDESSAALTRKFGEAGISHLAMANDPGPGHLSEREVVGPEFVAGAFDNARETPSAAPTPRSGRRANVSRTSAPWVIRQVAKLVTVGRTNHSAHRSFAVWSG